MRKLIFILMLLVATCVQGQVFNHNTEVKLSNVPQYTTNLDSLLFWGTDGRMKYGEYSDLLTKLNGDIAPDGRTHTVDTLTTNQDSQITLMANIVPNTSVRDLGSATVGFDDVYGRVFRGPSGSYFSAQYGNAIIGAQTLSGTSHQTSMQLQHHYTDPINQDLELVFYQMGSLWIKNVGATEWLETEMSGGIRPYTNNVGGLGDASHYWTDLYVTNINGSPYSSVSLDPFAGNIVPTNDASQDIGSPTKAIDSIFVDDIVMDKTQSSIIWDDGYGEIKYQTSPNRKVIIEGLNGWALRTNGNDKLWEEGGGTYSANTFLPSVDNTLPLGSSSYRWSHVYTDGIGTGLTGASSMNLYTTGNIFFGLSNNGNDVSATLSHSYTDADNYTTSLGLGSILFLRGKKVSGIWEAELGGSTVFRAATHNTVDLGSPSYYWNDLYVTNINGSPVSSFTPTSLDPFTGNIVPTNNASQDIGSTTRAIDSLWVDDIVLDKQGSSLKWDGMSGEIGYRTSPNSKIWTNATNGFALQQGGTDILWNESNVIKSLFSFQPSTHLSVNLGTSSLAWGHVYTDGVGLTGTDESSIGMTNGNLGFTVWDTTDHQSKTPQISYSYTDATNDYVNLTLNYTSILARQVNGVNETEIQQTTTFRPSSSNTIDLGLTGKRWKNVWAGDMYSNTFQANTGGGLYVGSSSAITDSGTTAYYGNIATNGSSYFRSNVSGSGFVQIQSGNTGYINLEAGTGGIKLGGKLYKSSFDTAPSSASDTGTAGEIRITATHIYVCTATNTWVRAALATW